MWSSGNNLIELQRIKMGAVHSSKEKLTRTYSERYIHSQSIERERFGSFGKRGKGKTATRREENEGSRHSTIFSNQF